MEDQKKSRIVEVNAPGGTVIVGTLHTEFVPSMKTAADKDIQAAIEAKGKAAGVGPTFDQKRK